MASADDLVQETYLKLCDDNFRMLRKFKSDHPDAFYGYLNVVTANLVHDHFKAAHSSKRGSGAIEIAVDEKIPLGCDALGGASGVKSSERGILLREIDAALGRLAAGPHLERDRKLFWLYYRVGLTRSIGAKTLPNVLQRAVPPWRLAGGTCPQTPAMQQRHRSADRQGPIPPGIVKPKWILHVLG